MLIKINPDKNSYNTLIDKINFLLHIATIGLKILDTAVDSMRLVSEPTAANAKKVVLDSAYLYFTYSGVNGYSAAVASIEASYQLYQGEYQDALKVVASTAGYMSLSYALAYVGMPYLSFAYGVGMLVYVAYNAISNANSLYQEKFKLEGVERSAQELKSYTAYLDVAKWLSETTGIEYFSTKVDEYAAKVSELKASIEQQSTEQQLQEEYGEEFGSKLFKYIYEPYIEEKRVLEEQVNLQQLSRQEAEAALGSKVVSIQGYEFCKFEDAYSNAADNGSGTKYFYCANKVDESIDRVAVGINGVEIIEIF